MTTRDSLFALRTEALLTLLYNMAAATAPYGSWVSPITSDVVIKESISLMEVRIDPFQEGRTIIEVGATKIKRQRSEIEVTRRLEKK